MERLQQWTDGKASRVYIDKIRSLKLAVGHKLLLLRLWESKILEQSCRVEPSCEVKGRMQIQEQEMLGLGPEERTDRPAADGIQLTTSATGSQ